MSVMPHSEPECKSEREAMVELQIEARTRDLGDGFVVRRLLPAAARRSVGPFVFFDHMGPVQMARGQGLDVRPHPHINLATVTYLFEGEILHRDSLGNEQLIRPGEVNWMTAGRGIAHSERSPAATRQAGARVHGLQLWVALPRADEEMEPSFQHHPADTIPTVERPAARLRVVAGRAFGAASPVHVRSPLFYVEAQLDAGAALPVPDDHAERAAYVVSGALTCDSASARAGQLLVFRHGADAALLAAEPTRVMLFGGAHLDGERHIWWNFVSSSRSRIERAKRDWRDRQFPPIPGDDEERIPLPE
jgi:redox-sensitive bicupin YhaK (pirin superfamily)